MKLNFRGLAIFSSLLFFALALTCMLAPDRLLSDWGVEFSSSVGLVCRRTAALFAGIATMFFSARNAEPSTARSALIKGVVLACLTLAALGIFELKAGRVTDHILVAVGIEVALTLAFLYVANSARTAAVQSNIHLHRE